MSLQSLHAELEAAGIPIHGVSGGEASVRVDYKDEATPPQRTQGDAIAAAHDWSPAATATYAAQVEKAEAALSVDRGAQKNGRGFERLCRAVADTALDATNAERSCMQAMNAAVQAATTLADLKTRFAAINFPPNVTGQQLVNSIKNKIANTPE